MNLVTYRAAHPGNAVRVQVHFDPLWWPRFWLAMWWPRFWLALWGVR